MRPRPIPWSSMALAIAPAIVACGGAPRTATPAPPKRAPSEAAIVLVRPTKDARTFESVWVEPSASGAVVRARRKEPILAAEDGLWAFRATLDRSRSCPSCDCEPGAPCERTSIELTHARAVRLGVDEVLALADPEPEACEEDGVHEASHAVELLGAIGAVLFIDTEEMSMACHAAHPFYDGEQFAFDLDRRERVDVAPPDPAPLLQRAHQELLDQNRECVMNAAETPSFWAATFRYGASGVLRGVYDFTMSAPYVCGTGPGHYSVLAEVEDEQLPPTMARFRTLPSWLVGWMRGRDDVGGVSVLPASLDAAGALAAFRGR